MTQNEAAREAITELFRTYSDELYKYAYYTLGNQQDAKDVVQETFVRVTRSWQGFRHDCEVRTWVWSIAKNCMRDTVRRRKRSKEAYTLNSGDLGQNTVQSNGTTIEIIDAIQKLPISQRQVVIMRVVNEFSTSETAKALGWSESKVRSTLHTAVVKLRSQLLN